MFELAPTPVSEWLTLFESVGESPAVRVRMAPIGPSALRSAQAALRDSAHPIEAYADDVGFDAFSRDLCRRSILEWEGVGQGGSLAPLTADTIDQLLGDPGALSRLQVLFVFPYLDRAAEKNASSPSSAGTTPATTGAEHTAPDAKKPAKSARTSSAPRKAAKAKPAGK